MGSRCVTRSSILVVATLVLILRGSAGAAEHDAVVTTADGLTLAARVSVPDGLTGQAPGVLLVQGSGPNDMDETIPGSLTATGRKTKIFKDIAQVLVAHGYLVFRFNKRGCAIDGDFAGWQGSAQEAIYQKASLSDLVGDVKAALSVFRHEPQLDASRVVLLGHSEGTWIAPKVARDDGHVAGLVLMGVMARSLRETLEYQLVERARSFAWDQVDANHDGHITPAEIKASPAAGLVGLPVDDASISSFMAAYDTDKNGSIDHDELETYLQYRFTCYAWKGPLASRWLKEHFQAPPNLDALEALTIPILALEGLVDVQTIPAETRMIQQDFDRHGKKNLDVDFFEGLGHGFSPPLDGVIPTVGPVEPRVLAALSTWMGDRFPSGATTVAAPPASPGPPASAVGADPAGAGAVASVTRVSRPGLPPRSLALSRSISDPAFSLFTGRWP